MRKWIKNGQMLDITPRFKSDAKMIMKQAWSKILIYILLCLVIVLFVLSVSAIGLILYYKQKSETDTPEEVTALMILVVAFLPLIVVMLILSIILLIVILCLVLGEHNKYRRKYLCKCYDKNEKAKLQLQFRKDAEQYLNILAQFNISNPNEIIKQQLNIIQDMNGVVVMNSQTNPVQKDGITIENNETVVTNVANKQIVV